jgi:hypothetical protein
VPTGTVEDHHGVLVRGQCLGEFRQEQRHGAGRDFGEDEGKAFAGGWLDGAEDVGPVEAMVAQAGRALPPEPPAMAQPSLLPNAGLILEIQADPLTGVGLRGRRYGVAQPPF